MTERKALIMHVRILTIVLALLFAPTLSSTAAAQSASESKVWYVPQPSEAGFQPVRHEYDYLTNIYVTNLSAPNAHFDVRAFDRSGLQVGSREYSIKRGQRAAPSFGGSASKAYSYLIIISNQPVIVQAKGRILLEPRYGLYGGVTRTEAGNGSCQKVTGVRDKAKTIYDYCPGDIDLTKYASDGAFQKYQIFAWEYVAPIDVPTYPIDCSDAPPDHFACSQRLRTITGGGGAGAVGDPGGAGVGLPGPNPATPGGAEDPAADRPADETASAGGEPSAQMDDNTDRPTGDFASFELTPGSPARCKEACDLNPLCKAWSYVRPGYSGNKQAACRLKNSVPEKVASPCCVSGVK